MAMPGYKTHLIAGAGVTALGVVLATRTGLWEPGAGEMAGAVAAGTAAALIPDIDTDSKGQNVFYALLFCLDLVLVIKGKWMWAALLGLTAMLPSIFTHRHMTHRWWAGLLIPAPILVFGPMAADLGIARFLPYYCAAVAGYFSHTALDGFISRLFPRKDPWM
jgi:energy-converting hydrogenase Eha subunit A